MFPLWIPVALVSAFSLGISNAFLKKAYGAHNEFLVTWLSIGVEVFLLLLLLPFVAIPGLGREFYYPVGIALPLEIVATVLYTKALKLSPLSLTLPFLSLSPVFLMGISYVIVGEVVSPVGAVGILFIAVGSYTLNIREIRHGFFQPFAAIFRERGSLYMIIVAFIYSITASLGKRAVMNSSPLFFAIAYLAAFFVCLTPVALYMGRKELGSVRSGAMLRASLLPGFSDFIATITYVIGLSLAKVAYIISVRRLAVLVGVLFGFLLFKESGVGERLLGAILMLVGFAVIVFAS